MQDNPFDSVVKMFASDNYAGAHPKIMEAVVRYNSGFAASYGEDELTREVEERIAELFEHECAVFLVGTGTAANALALSALCPPYGAIYCHPEAHINTDECGAPEMYTGAKLVPVNGPHGKIDPAALKAELEGADVHGIHRAKPSVVSITNLTEAGTVCKPDEVNAIMELARHFGLKVYLDGARFANAIAALNLTPAEMSWKAGVDVMSFGATKNGAIAAEAIIFFNPDDAKEFERIRKRAGQLWSKHRFLSAQFLAYLENDLWLKNAAHSNAMAKRLAEGLSALPGISMIHPVEGNELFPEMPESVISGLENDGFSFYRWPPRGIRLVTSFATPEADVDEFIESAIRHISEDKPA